jgi:hypothetical protein
LAAAFLGNQTVQLVSQNNYRDVTDAMTNYELNDASSKTVYNQMVTNGWVAKDLLKTIGTQNASIIDNQVATAQLLQGTNTLLTYGLGTITVLGLVLIFFMSKRKQ